MGVPTIDRIGSLLDQQIEFFGDLSISLDSLWRAAGRPLGKDPESWASRAANLVSAYAEYIGGLDATLERRPPELPPLWRWCGEDGDPWRSGDMMGPEFLARIYASFLRRD